MFVDGLRVGHEKVPNLITTTQDMESTTDEMDSFLTREFAPEVTTVLNFDVSHIGEYVWRISDSDNT